VTVKSLADIPRARGHWLLGNAGDMRREAHLFVSRLCHANGGLARFRVLNRVFVATTNAAHVRHWLVARHDRYGRSFPMRNGALVLGPGLLTADGDQWLKHRRMLLPPFRRGCLPPVVDATRDAVLAMQSRLHGGPRTVSPTTEMRRLALDVISRMLFSEPMRAEVADWFSAMVTEALQLIFKRNYQPVPLPFGTPTADHRRLWRIKAGLDGYLGERIAARRRESRPEPRDMLDAILAARDAETGRPLPAAQVLSEVKTLFVAGFETSATALTWALFCLARHAAEAEAWATELDTVLGGRDPAWDDVERLPYLGQIVHETLRLYPPVFASVRETLVDDEMDGYVLPRGTQCLISIYGMHRSPEYWSEPDRFRPARFAPGATWEKDAFLPFLVGKHQCIGNHFAMLEITLALAMIGQRYRIEATDDRPVGTSPQITLAPDREILLRFSPRS
jgi:enediyne biosynthesis protein E7